MTIEEIKTMVNGPDYDFLRTNPHLGGGQNYLPHSWWKLFIWNKCRIF